MEKKLKLVLISLLLGPVLFWAFNNVEAKSGFTIVPAKISLTIDKGNDKESVINVKNAGDNPIGVLIDVQDFVPTANTTNFNFVRKAPGITSLVDWITISKKTFQLKTGESKDVDFTVKVPEDASPGSRFAVIFFSTGAPPGEGGQLNVSARVGSLVFLTVPGDFKQTGEVSNFRTEKFFQKGPVSFKFDFLNTGTVFFEPKGTITIANIFNKKVGEVLVEGNVVLPTGMRSIGTVWEKPDYLLGIYKAHLAISVTGKGDIAESDVSFYAFPIIPGIATLVILIVLVLLVIYIRRNFRFNIARVDKEESALPNQNIKQTWKK